MTANGWAPDGLAIDRASVVPIYRQLYERLREQILTGALPEGTRLPPERALAGRLGVNRSTVVQGYRELVADGLIEQRVGSGSRVAALREGVPERSAAGVPWWVTLPPWRVGQYPAVLGELAASEHGEQIAFVQGVPPAEPSPLAATGPCVPARVEATWTMRAEIPITNREASKPTSGPRATLSAEPTRASRPRDIPAASARRGPSAGTSFEAGPARAKAPTACGMKHSPVRSGLRPRPSCR